LPAEAIARAVPAARAFPFHYNDRMTMIRTLTLAVLCLALVAGAVVSMEAQAGDRGRGHARGQSEVYADRAITLDEAVAQAERRYKARVVRAEEKRHGDRIEYRIRLLGEDGRVFEVRIDAESGRED
jgi:uncharacterized membrane protein YkoI